MALLFAYRLVEVATMKLSIASRMGAVTTDDEAREFAEALAQEARDDNWIRVLYAVETPDAAEIDVLTFMLEHEPKRKTG
jgi:hypothetical protein